MTSACLNRPATHAREPRQRPTRRLAILLLLSLLLPGLLLGLATRATGQDLLSGNRTDTGNLLFSNQDDFLPVTEAFRLQTFIYQNQLILHWDVEPAYYLYKERFRIQAEGVDLPAPDFTTDSIDKYDEYFEREMAVFYGAATLSINLSDITAPFALRVDSQGCADAGLCYPPHSDYFRVDPVSASIHPITPEHYRENRASSGTEAAQSGLWWASALLLALLGGVILNLMPCVFPVLSIKVMSLAQADRRRLPAHGWAYTAGILASFGLFGLALILARAGGEAIGWGFQLQSPLLIGALAYLFFILGLSLSGLVQLGTRWMGIGQALTQKSGLGGSFFTGVLAAVVASPCTAPFMGAALGFALTQPAAIGLLVFIALGLGMALPLLLLCYLPGLAERLPRPGPWMETLKQALAFPLYLTAIWLLWVLGRQAGSDAMIALLCGALAIAFGCWLLARAAQGPVRRSLRTLLVASAWLLAVLLPLQALNPASPDQRWQPYSPERLAQLRSQGRPVFINLTADWCLTCLANERAALSTAEVEHAFDTLGIATLKGDWTNRDPQITALLETYGRSGVPLYLWYPAGQSGPAQVLPQILTRNRVLEVIDPENRAR